VTRRFSVPAWIFERTPAYFLLGLPPDSDVVDIDGGHSSPKGVAEAKHLRESIACIRPKPGTRFFMLKVEEVPEFKGKVNNSAIATLNEVAKINKKNRAV
jgi:hypothetical protein